MKHRQEVVVKRRRDADRRREGERHGRSHNELHRLGRSFMWRCYYCHRPVHCVTCEPNHGNDKLRATRDHFVPKSHGGRDRGPNIVLACKGCNSAKGAEMPDARRDYSKRARRSEAVR
jgi:5-methylcytosine-specific restriction endonuclease McrA